MHSFLWYNTILMGNCMIPFFTAFCYSVDSHGSVRLSGPPVLWDSEFSTWSAFWISDSILLSVWRNAYMKYRGLQHTKSFYFIFKIFCLILNLWTVLLGPQSFFYLQKAEKFVQPTEASDFWASAGSEHIFTHTTLFHESIWAEKFILTLRPKLFWSAQSYLKVFIIEMKIQFFLHHWSLLEVVRHCKS